AWRHPASGCRSPSRSSSCIGVRTLWSLRGSRLALARYLPTILLTHPTLSESEACGYAGGGQTHHAEPHTSRAVSTTRRSLGSSPCSSMVLPPTPLENPHCGLRASCSSGACLLASSMRRLSSSFDSSLALLVVTRPRTAALSLGRKRSGSKPPARALSYSRK